MAGLLSGIEPSVPAGEPAQADVADLLSRRAATQRRRVRWQATVTAAACLVLLAGGIAAGVAAASRPGQAVPPAVAVEGQRHSAIDPVTGVAGTVGLVAKSWGTQVTLDLSKVRGPLQCELIAVSTTGEQRVALGWLVAAAGYGVPGHPAHLVVAGGTAIPLTSLSRIFVKVVNGRTLVSIPV